MLAKPWAGDVPRIFLHKICRTTTDLKDTGHSRLGKHEGGPGGGGERGGHALPEKDDEGDGSEGENDGGKSTDGRGETEQTQMRKIAREIERKRRIGRRRNSLFFFSFVFEPSKHLQLKIQQS